MRRLAKTIDSTGVATVKDVALLAGVSTATVSRVLSGGSGVTEALQAKVVKAARTLGYRPNRAARDLRARSSRTVGVLIPDIENPFFTSVVRGIEEALHKASYTLVLANYNEDPALETAQLQAFRSERLAGLIFACSREPSPVYEQIAAAGAPMVAVSRAPGRLRTDQVLVANREGAFLATSHLIANGHSRIAFINGPVVFSTAREREQGYERALAEAGLALNPDLVAHCEFRQSAGHDAMLRLLTRRCPPTAVFAASHLLTLGALQAIHERELDVPGQVAIVGYDETAWAISLRPPLTTVAQPAFEVGQTAAQIILERIRKPDQAQKQIVLETRLMARASSGAPALRGAAGRR